MTDHLALLRRDADLMLAALADGDRIAPVPGCPGWTVAELVTHAVGAALWVERIVAAGTQPQDRDLPEPPPGAELLAWARDGLARTVDTLTTTAADAPTWHPLGGVTDCAWWRRKAAVEQAIHRWDAQSAGDADPAAIDPGLALDGIVEFASEFLPLMVELPGAPEGVIRLDPTDVDGGALVLDLGRGRATSLVEDVGVTSDATLTGRASDLLLWVWNRPVTIDAPEALARSWAELRI